MADWSSLPGDLVFSIGDLLLADTDLDYYMNFRAVCSHWRQSSLDPKEHSSDPRFQLKKWAVMQDYGCNHDIKMVNLLTCRIVRKKIRQLLNYYAADGGLLVLGERSLPDGRVWVLNPFTGSKVCFPMPLPAEEVRQVAVTSSLFVSNLWNSVGWAKPNTEEVRQHRVQLPNYIVSMAQFTGDVYVADRYGSIVSTADQGIVMSQTIIGSADNGPYNYLVESVGELLLVTRRINVGLVDVHKVNTVWKVLEPVTSIGRRAIFISQVRSFVVDAFPTIEAGCIYFVDADLDLDQELDLDFGARHRIIASSYRLEDQRQEDIMESGKVGRRCGPPTILEILIDYCRSTPTQEYEVAYREDDDDFEGY
ncbi:hypothetical protein EJB05_16316, partial [Eragrostis curvula]